MCFQMPGAVGFLCPGGVIVQNGISKQGFTNFIKELLEKGHSKFRNLMIFGPANSA